MMQAMVLVGVLAICAVSGALLTYRSRRAPGPELPGPEEPTASPPAMLPPAPGPPPAAAAAPVKPTQPLPAETAVAPVPAPPARPPVRRGRNSGFDRFGPAVPAPVVRITARAPR